MAEAEARAAAAAVGRGVLVTKISPISPNVGVVALGDEIIEINGEAVLGLSAHKDAMRLIKAHMAGSPEEPLRVRLRRACDIRSGCACPPPYCGYRCSTGG